MLSSVARAGKPAPAGTATALDPTRQPIAIRSLPIDGQYKPGSPYIPDRTAPARHQRGKTLVSHQGLQTRARARSSTCHLNLILNLIPNHPGREFYFKNKTLPLNKISDKKFHLKKRIYHDLEYGIALSNSNISFKDTIFYNLKIIKVIISTKISF